MKKIIIFGFSNTYGGIESVVSAYGKDLMKQNVDIHVVFYDNIPNYHEDLIINGFTIHVCTSRRTNIVKNIIDTWRLLNSVKPDSVWHNVVTLSDIMPLIVARLTRVKIRVLHGHNSKNTGNQITALLHAINKQLVYIFANVYLACDERSASWIMPKRIIRSKKYTVVHNVIDSEKYKFNLADRNYWRTKLGVDERTILLGHSGRFETQKNHKFLIEIFKSIKETNNSIKLLLVGDGSLFKPMKALATKYSLQDDIIFMGHQKDLRSILSTMDIFLFPSLYEGFSLSLLEAQANGLPCTVSNTILKDSNVTGNVNFFDIEGTAAYWAKKISQVTILNDETRISTSSSCVNIINDAGYDIHTESVKLLRLITEVHI